MPEPEEVTRLERRRRQNERRAQVEKAAKALEK
jgi:hypothetical protein